MAPTDLAQMNAAALGTATTPSITLASGQRVQTGTVAALLVNIRAYDALYAQRDSGAASEECTGDEERLQGLEEALRAAVPTLEQVGMFELFGPGEWVDGEGASEGRRVVGRYACEWREGT